MKQLSIIIAFVTAISTGLMFSSCEESGLTEEEVAEGLRQALVVGTDTAVKHCNKEDGYFKHDIIKILLPEEADPVVEVVSLLPGGQLLLDELVLKLNRSAEDAAIKAKPIFVDAIMAITFDDAFNILNGQDNAATEYLNQNTNTQLYESFKPDVENSLSSVGAQQAWEEVMTLYNSVPLVKPVNVDLADYSTHRALDGVFHRVENEEKNIRNEVSHQVTETLRTVFGE